MTDTFNNDHVTISQQNYPNRLYQSEVSVHNSTLSEYTVDILNTMKRAQEAARANIRLYDNQPYLNAMVRSKLVDFLLKMSVRLKIVPFVFYRAVRLFDRYCLRRILLLDQAQLIITSCLWIAAKVNGGNNHFANLQSDKRSSNVRTISDLGYGSGARFKGPTERYRLPKLNELIKLCGSRCNYDAEMFKQMEVHIMVALDWKLNDPMVDDYVVALNELRVMGGDEELDSKLVEFFRIKRFIAYATCYLYELVQYTPLEVGRVLVDLVNDTYSLQENDAGFQRLNYFDYLESAAPDTKIYCDIRRHLIRAVVRAPPYLLSCFELRGPQLLVLLLSASYRPVYDAQSVGAASGLNTLSVSLVSTLSVYSSYSYALPDSAATDVLPEYSCRSPSEMYRDGFYFGSLRKHAHHHPQPPQQQQHHHLPALRTPGAPSVEAAHNHSHLYPLCPPRGRAKSLGSSISGSSQGSCRLSLLYKEGDIFDSHPSDYGLSTPVSDEECKADVVTKRRAF